MKTLNRIMRSAMPLALLLLAACGSGSGIGASAPVAVTTTGYSAGGAVSGLIGTVVLQDNGGDTLNLTANGNFTFATKILNGNTYNVTVLTQPPGQTCSVSTGAGTVSGGNVTNVAVVCSTNAYSVGGNVNGLIGSVVLQDNNGDNLSVNANGAITFATKVAFGSPYSVTVLTQPVGQSCSLASNTGTMGTTAVTNVAITCVTNTYTVGGTVSKLNGSLVLQNNNGDNLTVAVNGAFNFATAVSYGNPYSVTVLTQPPGQTCSVSTGAGTVSGGNVTNVVVVCSTDAYSVGGNVSGLTGSVVLQDNNGDNLSVNANGAITFATMVAFGSPYSVTVLTQPVGQSCSLASNTGTMGTAAVTNVAITCVNNSYTIGGTVSKLNGSLVLQDNNGDNLTVAVNGAFNFATAVSYGNPYSVTVFTQPAGQVCSVVSGSGSATANVTNVAIACASQMGGAMQGTALNLVSTSVVSTLAGSGGAGSLDGTGTAATFDGPLGTTTDGINLYVVDNCGTTSNDIRKVVLATGVVTTLAGSSASGAADGTGLAATFSCPNDITTDGSALYVVDYGNNMIRKIAPASGTLANMTSANAVVTTLAGSTVAGAVDGTGTAASFKRPQFITTDGSNLYVTDTQNYKIRRIAPASGTLAAMTSANAVVTSLTGTANTAMAGGTADGTGTAATFNWPSGITTDGSNLYVVDGNNRKIRRIAPASGTLACHDIRQRGGDQPDGHGEYGDDSGCGRRRGHGGHIQPALRHHHRRHQPVCGGWGQPENPQDRSRERRPERDDQRQCHGFQHHGCIGCGERSRGC